MKLLGRKKDNADVGGAEVAGVVSPIGDSSATGPAAGARGSQTTAPKGRPTPKRGDRGTGPGKKGPVVPAPMTAAQARARRKTMAGPKLSRAERRVQSAARRDRMAERRERMMAGDEAYLLPRDQGPIRRFVRDVVDSRRNALGLFMPSALGLMFVMFAVPQLQVMMSPAMLVLMALMLIDGLLLSRKVSNLVDEKFPQNAESRWKLGIYAAGRATQLRRMRTPRPAVKRGSDVA